MPFKIKEKVWALEKKEKHELDLTEAFKKFKQEYKNTEGKVMCVDCDLNEYKPIELIKHNLAVEYNLDSAPIMHILKIKCCRTLHFWRLSRFQNRWNLGKIEK